MKDNVMIRMPGVSIRLVRFAPDSWLRDETLLDEAHLERIRGYLADAWTACHEYVEQQSLELVARRNVIIG